MTSKPLARDYDALTASERSSLFLSAYFRGDDREVGRLVRSAPRIRATSTDSWHLTQGFLHLASAVLADLLGLAAQVGFFRSIALQSALKEKADFSPEETQHMIEAADAAGVRFGALLSAWDQFCEGKGIPPRAYWQTLPGHDALQLAEMMLANQTKALAAQEAREAEVTRYVREMGESLRMFE